MVSTSSQPLSFLCVLPCGRVADAWPIEIAWGFAAGDVRSMLLRPDPDWPLTSWDKSHEGKHRIGLEALLQDGKPPLDACLVLNAALGQSDVVSPSPEADSVWLYKLYRSAGVSPNYTIRALDCDTDITFVRAADGVRALREGALPSQTG